MNNMAVTRKNILTDTDSRDKFITGVKLLKNDFLNPNWVSTYDVFIIWHFFAMMTLTPQNSQVGRNAAHSGPAFLPWHRWFLILLENHLQRVLDDPNFGLPYWDWAQDGELPLNQQQNATIWSDSYMGGTGIPVTTGPFADGSWEINIEARTPLGSFSPSLFWANRPLQRELGVDTNRGLPTKAQVRSAVHDGEPNVIYDSPGWDSRSFGFRNILEGWPQGPRLHNLVHVWVGGDMGPATSPNDPIFYMNHCNVDRIWAGWQQIHANPDYLPDDDESSSLQGHRLNDNLFAVTTSSLFDPIYQGNVRPSDLLDVSSIYIYDTVNDMV